MRCRQGSRSTVEMLGFVPQPNLRIYCELAIAENCQPSRSIFARSRPRFPSLDVSLWTYRSGLETSGIAGLCKYLIPVSKFDNFS